MKSPTRQRAAASFLLFTLLLVVNAPGARGQGAAALGHVAFTPVLPTTAAQSAPALSAREVSVFGQKIYYQEAGSGPVVVLLHGLGGNTGNWGLNVPELSRKFRVVVPDQIGFGASDKPFINYRIGTYVDFLDMFLTQLKIERASLVGNSMGGWVAASYALKHPSRVERLVLVDAAGFAPPKEFDLGALSGLNPTTRDAMRQLAALVFYNKTFSANDVLVDAMLAARISAGDGYTIGRLVESIHRGEDMLDGRLSAVKQPTLIVWGRDDGLTPLAREGEKFRQGIPHAQLQVFDQCGHVPQVEKSAEFNAAVLKFLTAAN